MALLARLLGVRRYLEIGTYTGYSALAIALALEPDGKVLIRGLPPALLQREKLIAEIDESRVFALAAQFEVEQAAIEGQRLFDVTDLDRDVIETDSVPS